MFTNTMVISVMLLCTSLILYNTPSVSASSQPLLLTPYIQEGDINTARKLSLVDDKTGIIPRSYAGFITVDQQLGNNLFFWFFPALSYNPKAPLLIWLNGGPGESSMIGLLIENGPIQLGQSYARKPIYKKRNNSWVNKFSVLYIDNPVGTGYSFSVSGANGARTTQDGYTRDLYEFIQQFYKLFPEFLQRDMYIGGESYAGKYVPALAFKVHEEIQRGSSNIPLKGIYIDAPFCDAGPQLNETIEFYYALGYITKTELDEYQRNLTEIIPQSESQQFLFDLIPLLYPNAQDNVYTYEQVPENEINAVMTSDYLRSLLHVGNLPFQAFNLNVFFSLVRDDFFVPSVSKLPELFDNYKVLIYTGDLDGTVSNPSVESVVQSLPWSSQAAYNSSRRQVWKDENDQIKGFFTRVSTFCRVVIRGAGHRVAFDRPDNTLEMMEHFVANGCLC